MPDAKHHVLLLIAMLSLADAGCSDDEGPLGPTVASEMLDTRGAPIPMASVRVSLPDDPDSSLEYDCQTSLLPEGDGVLMCPTIDRAFGTDVLHVQVTAPGFLPFDEMVGVSGDGLVGDPVVLEDDNEPAETCEGWCERLSACTPDAWAECVEDCIGGLALFGGPEDRCRPIYVARDQCSADLDCEGFSEVWEGAPDNACSAYDLAIEQCEASLGGQSAPPSDP